MRIWSIQIGISLAVSLVFSASAQQPAPPQAAPIERHDPALDAATNLIGRALILRCFCADNSIAFDEDGHAEPAGKITDWTLAGVNVLKVERKEPATIELDGVRVAIRYAPDRHEFDRHPMNDEKIKILLHGNPDNASAFDLYLREVFSVGIDVALQQTMPAYWQHYFIPTTPWPKDGLEGETIATAGASGAAAGLTEPRATKRSEPTYTTEASHDRVLGTVVVNLVVDAQGQPRRPVIAQPLGYGLDANTVEATEKYRFQPANAGGKNVASYVEIRQAFTATPAAP